jgi:hypothetical protein
MLYNLEGSIDHWYPKLESLLWIPCDFGSLKPTLTCKMLLRDVPFVDALLRQL